MLLLDTRRPSWWRAFDGPGFGIDWFWGSAVELLPFSRERETQKPGNETDSNTLSLKVLNRRAADPEKGFAKRLLGT